MEVANKILVVDDDPDLCELLSDVLSRNGYAVDTTTDGAECPRMLQQAEYDAVLLDLELGSGQSGLALCERIVEHRPDLPVVIVTGHGSLNTAIGAIRAGAYDFVTKPLSMDTLMITLGRAVEHKRLHDEVRRLQAEIGSGNDIPSIVGTSAPMRAVYDLVARVSATDASVLITGESGTGKELVARAIHDRSARGEGAFVAINCAAMPPTLLESELFGHSKGAFTDAKRSRSGLFVQASGGTMFLDEIGEMPLEMQVKLLRVIQERTVRPVGGTEEIPFDARIIAATNRDLESDVDAGTFREDLFYRINVVRIEVPPLRARGNDVLLLAQSFIERASANTRRAVRGIDSAAARKLLDYDWPGNVRELQNCIEHAVALTQGPEIQLSDLPERVRTFQSARIVLEGEDPSDLLTLDEVEHRYINRVLDAVKGNKTHASRVLGMDRRTLYRKLEKFEGARASN